MSAFQEHMKAQTEMACKAVIEASFPSGRPPSASIEPRRTPSTPVVEFPALKRTHHEPITPLLPTP